MKKPTRITLTNTQAASTSGKALLNLMLDICHDGVLEIEEIQDLHDLLGRLPNDIAAVPFLRAFTREILEDGIVTGLEEYRLKQAMMRVATKEVRGVIEHHLKEIELPTEGWEQSDSWRADPATSRQLEFIRNLGGQIRPGLTKGQASQLIDQLLQNRGPSPRQVLLIRFFDRTDLLSKPKDEVSQWIDGLFAHSLEYEQAWMRFKRETQHDPFETDPNSVPIGAYRKYLRR